MSDATPTARLIRRLRLDAAMWALLVALVGVSLFVAEHMTAASALPIEVGISVVQVAVLLLVFMQLRSARALILLTALSGAIFVTLLFTLTFNDLFTRV